MKAVTDAGPTEPNQPKHQAIENLFSLMKVVSTPETIKHFDDLYNSMQIRYGDLKKQLAEDMLAFVAPLSEKIKDLASNDDYLRKVAKQGAEKARESASKTIRDVREIIGFKPF
jgi:tryptophanyl-tRNA synthetase